MTNIIEFPRQAKGAIQDKPKAANLLPKAKVGGLGATAFKGFWVFTVLIWPVLKWVISIDCVFQLVRMIFHWRTPGIYAGWMFILHFSVLTALTYFVSVYKPKGL